jgi:hypothetical protein
MCGGVLPRGEREVDPAERLRFDAEQGADQ